MRRTGILFLPILRIFSIIGLAVFGLPGDELLFRDGVVGRAEGDDHFVFAGGNEFANHFQDFRVALCIGNVQPGVEGGETGEVDMAVAEGRDQRPAAQPHPGKAGISGGQFIAHMDDSSAVLNEKLINMILCITGQNTAFVNLHRDNLDFSFDVPIIAQMGRAGNDASEKTFRRLFRSANPTRAAHGNGRNTGGWFPERNLILWCIMDIMN